MEGEEAPEDIKLFTNMPSLGFSDCDDGPCAAKFTLTAEDLLADRVCELKMAKFNYVNVLDRSSWTPIMVLMLPQLAPSRSTARLEKATNMANFKKVG